jgi:hypothetical protein
MALTASAFSVIAGAIIGVAASGPLGTTNVSCTDYDWASGYPYFKPAFSLTVFSYPAGKQRIWAVALRRRRANNCNERAVILECAAAPRR